MNALANLTRYLTLPYQRGAEFQVVSLGGDDHAGATKIPCYEFTEYRARWGGDPPVVPTYVIAPQVDVGGDDVALTLSYGLRYEFDRPPVDTYNTISNFDRANGAMVVPNDTVLKASVNQFFPRTIPIVTAPIGVTIGIVTHNRVKDSTSRWPS